MTMSLDSLHLYTASIDEYFRKRQTDILSLTRALVEEESPSGDEAGSRAVVSLLAAEARTIAPVTTIERISNGQYGEHLRLRAFDGGDSRVKPIVILGHTDTVHPRGSLAVRPWRIEGNHAYGPGVFDMKANCALAIESIRACAALGISPRGPLVLLLTCDEERGSVHGRGLVEAEAEKSKAVLVLEPPATGGRVKTGRKGTGSFTLEAHGLAAHAGLEPEKGASAVLELARQIQRLHELNNSSGGISVNVGVIRGGTVSNVVPAEAWAEIDIRFVSKEESEQIEQLFRDLQPFDRRVELVVRGEINRPPLERGKQVVALYEHARSIAAAFGYELGEAQVGGASDGNFAAAVGASVLDGLGLDGDGAHAVHEHILIDDIPKRGALLTALMATL
jgi:glutamate carboxypeptidase